jgi:hypothetical protein
VSQLGKQPFALSLSKGFDELSPNGGGLRNIG